MTEGIKTELPPKGYREILKAKLEQRCSANPRYSLRAFARDLDLSSSRLSQVLRGKQGLSVHSARKLCAKLGLSPQETENFCDWVTASDARSRTERKIAEIKLLRASDANEYRRLIELDVFRAISDWYHFAVLELTQIKGFKSDLKWIARKLGISVTETEGAVQRLTRLGLLTSVGGKLRSTEAHLSTPDGIPSEAIQKFNRQVLEKAIAAIPLQSVDERDLSTLTVAIRTEDLPELRKVLREFRKKFNQSAMQRNKDTRRPPDEVYCLAMQFFRLTEKGNI